MIACTDFIPAYSELFKYLHQKGGRAEVEAFWNYLSDRFLSNLRQLVQENGIFGCWLYWSRTLNEESADFAMELDEEAGVFHIEMHRCPSMTRLIETPQIEPYHDYCRHCDVLYRRVLEPLGYSYDIDVSQCKQARCSVTVTQSSLPADGARTAGGGAGT